MEHISGNDRFGSQFFVFPKPYFFKAADNIPFNKGLLFNFFCVQLMERKSIPSSYDCVPATATVRKCRSRLMPTSISGVAPTHVPVTGLENMDTIAWGYNEQSLVNVSTISKSGGSSTVFEREGTIFSKFPLTISSMHFDTTFCIARWYFTP
ncbi:MAG: hypothetical protein WDN75_10885 [Bacteroidota bacterium]